MKDAFISYARIDKSFVQKIHRALVGYGKDVWVDWEGINPGYEFPQEIQEAIEGAGNFIFVISPNSIASKWCLKELDHANQYNKRIIPFLLEQVPELPEGLENWQWVDYWEEKDFESAVLDLQDCLDIDIERAKLHTAILGRAIEWDQGEDKSLLMRGEELTRAEEWLADSAEKEPKPTALQSRYILESRREATRSLRRTILLGAGAILVISVLAVFATISFLNAVASENQRATQQAIAELEADARATEVIIRQTSEGQAIEAEGTAIAEAAARATALVNEEAARAIAQAEQLRAEQQSRISLSRQLAAQAINEREQNQLDLALLLSAAAGRTADTFEARDNLLEMLFHPPSLRMILPTNGAWASELSQDGDLMATSYRSSPYRIKLWDCSDTSQIDYLGEITLPEGHRPTFLRIAPDNRVMASSSSYPERSLLFFDLSNLVAPAFLSEFPLDEPLNDLIFQPDGGPILAFRDRQGETSYFEAADLVAPDKLQRISQAEYDRAAAYLHPLGPLSFAWNAGALDLVTQTNSGEPHTLSTLILPDDRQIVDYAYSPVRNLLALSDPDQNLSLWDLSNPAEPVMIGEPFSAYPGEEYPGGGENSVGDFVVLHPDGNLLAVSRCIERVGTVVPVCDESVVDLWNISDPTHPYQLRNSLTGFNGAIVMLWFFPDGMLLATRADRGGILLWDVSSKASYPAIIMQAAALEQVEGGAISSQPKHIFISEIGDDEIGLVEITESTKLHRPPAIQLGDFGPVSSVLLNSESLTLAASRIRDGAVNVWDLRSPDEPIRRGWKALPDGEHIHNLALSAGGRLLAFEFNDVIELWPLAGDARPTTLNIASILDGETVRSIALAPSGDLLAVSTSGGKVWLWDISDINDPTLCGEGFQETGAQSISLSFGGQGDLLFTGDPGDEGGFVRIWDVSDPAHPQPTGDNLFEDMAGLAHLGFTGYALSNSGQLLATSACTSENAAGECWDSVTQLWDLSNPASPRSYSRSLPWSGELSFGPGDGLLMIDRGEQAHFWDLTLESWIELACQRAGRDFTQDEWHQYFPDQPYQHTCPMWPAED